MLFVKPRGYEKREYPRRENINKQTFLEMETGLEDFKSVEAILKDISEGGVRFELSLGRPIPQVFHLIDIPIKFKIPDINEVIETKARVIRIFSLNEKDEHIYGICFEFSEMEKNFKKIIIKYTNEGLDNK